MQYITWIVLTYISGIIDSFNFSENIILTEQHKETVWINYPWIFMDYVKKIPVLRKKEKQNFDIPQGK